MDEGLLRIDTTMIPNTRKTISHQYEGWLILEVRQGLANRICALVSGQWLAKLYRRHLIVSWPVEPACPCRYSDLFEQSFPIFDSVAEAIASLRLNPEQSVHENFVSDLSECLQGLNLSSVKNPVIVLRIPFFCYEKSDRETRADFRRLPVNWASEPFADEKTIAIFAAVLRQLQGPRWPELLAITPRADILDEVENFRTQHFINLTVGIHMRGTDNRFCKRQESFFLDWIRRLLSVSDGPRIYVASDDGATTAKVLAMGSNRILIREVPRNFSCLRQTEMREALIDMLILSKVERIYKAPFSSFSIVSAAYGKVSVTVIHRHWLLRLPGMMVRIIGRVIARAHH
jgi:hypothetical protein